MFLTEEETKVNQKIETKKSGFDFSSFFKKNAYSFEQSKKSKIKLSVISVFAKQLSGILNSGLQLATAFDVISDEMEDGHFKTILTKIREMIVSGVSFSEAAKQFPKAFPNLLISMAEAGEASGTLPETMLTASEYLEASLKMQKKLKSALIYPVSIITIALLLVTALLIFVVPVFKEMFDGFGAKLPLPTQMLITTSEFLKNNIIFSIIVFSSLFYGTKKFINTKKGHVIYDWIVRCLPLIGKLSQKSNISHFCRTYSILLKSGIPILKIVNICENSTENTFVRDACDKIREGIQSGQQLSEILSKVSYFPSLVRHMSKAGEQSGNVEGMIKNVAELYDQDVNNAVGSLLSLLEPLIVCFLGVVIGGIVLAMFLPIFQLSSIVGG